MENDDPNAAERPRARNPFRDKTSGRVAFPPLDEALQVRKSGAMEVDSEAHVNLTIGMQSLINNDSFDGDQQPSSPDGSQPDSPFPWAKSGHSSPERNPPQPSLLSQGTPDSKWVAGRHSMYSDASSGGSPEQLCMADFLADFFMAAQHQHSSPGSPPPHSPRAPSLESTPGNTTVIDLGHHSPFLHRATPSTSPPHPFDASCFSPSPTRPPAGGAGGGHPIGHGASPAMSPFAMAPSTPLPGNGHGVGRTHSGVLNTPQTPATPASCLKRFTSDPLGLAPPSSPSCARRPSHRAVDFRAAWRTAPTPTGAATGSWAATG
ncbi:hypothetical protein T484DRAFT_1884634 [Baffinella frigidus]|nr:hypothetical protein T484DRAFT_1884634 [Cryptophyta sp. CCMP2293]